MMKKILLKFSFLSGFVLTVFFCKLSLASVDIIEYQVKLKPDFKNKTLSGFVNIQIDWKGENKVTLPLSAVDKEILQVNGSWVTGYRVENEKLYVDLLRKSDEKANQSSIKIEYKAKPIKGLTFKDDHVFTLYHTNHWLVTGLDLTEKSAIDLEIVLPKAMRMVANGEQISSEVKGQNMIHHWRETRFRPLYTFGFAAGFFKTKILQFEDMNFQVLFLKSTEAEIETMFADVGKAYQFFSEISGTELSNKQYTFVVTDGTSMQEASSFSLVGRDFVRDVLNEPRESWLMVHELAHEWWGNSITAESWRHFWLNEGLVQFLVAAFKEKYYGKAEYDREIIFFKEAMLRQIKAEHKLVAVSPEHEITFSEFKSHYRKVAYNKGAFVFHMLRNELGEQVFWRGLKLYSQRFKEGKAKTSDLQHSFEIAAKRKLDVFFQTWVNQPQDLSVDVHIEQQQDKVTFTVLQHQEKVQHFNLNYLVLDQSGKEFEGTIKVHTANQKVDVNVGTGIAAVYIDPKQYLPVQIKVTGAEAYVEKNQKLAGSTLTKYWSLKALLNSAVCESDPDKINFVFAELLEDKHQDRIIEQAIGWWKDRCY